MSLDLVLIMLAVGALAAAGVAVLAPDAVVAADPGRGTGVSVTHALAAEADAARQGPQYAGLPILSRQDGRQQWSRDLADRQVWRRDQGRRPELVRTVPTPQTW